MSDDTIELCEDSSDEVLSWINSSPKTYMDESSISSSSTESLTLGDNDGCSDSDSSIICLEEFQHYEIDSSPFKKIKLEKTDETELTNSVPSVPSLELTVSNPSENTHRNESDSGIASSVSLSAEPDCKINPKFMSVKRLSREDLETMIMKHMVDAITADKQISTLEEKLENTERLLKLSTEKNSKLSQEVTNLDLVLKRFLMQVQSGQVKVAHPPKKTVRSVGVQVKPETVKRIKKMALLMENAEKNDSTKKNVSNSEGNNNTATITEVVVVEKLSDPADQANKKDVGKATDPLKEVEKVDCPPLPSPMNVPADPSWKPPPPKLFFGVKQVALSLSCFWYAPRLDYADVSVYRIWGYSKSSCPSGKWEQLAAFPPSPLPMTCLIDGSKLAEYSKISEVCCFVIRATDVHGRDGPWSDTAFITFP